MKLKLFLYFFITIFVLASARASTIKEEKWNIVEIKSEKQMKTVLPLYKTYYQGIDKDKRSETDWFNMWIRISSKPNYHMVAAYNRDNGKIEGFMDGSLFFSLYHSDPQQTGMMLRIDSVSTSVVESEQVALGRALYAKLRQVINEDLARENAYLSSVIANSGKDYSQEQKIFSDIIGVYDRGLYYQKAYPASAALGAKQKQKKRAGF